RRLLIDFVRRQAEQGELVEWVVGVMGQGRAADRLGSIDLGIEGLPRVNMIERTRLRDSNSLGVITSPTHLGLGLSDEQLERVRDRGVCGWNRWSGRGLMTAITPESWRALPSRSDLYAELAAEAVAGADGVFLAVDHDGTRHVLLAAEGEMEGLSDERSRGI